MPSNSTYVCVPCRMVKSKPTEHCLQCGGPIQDCGPKWRAPRKSNDTAWKRIEAGDWLWEHSKIDNTTAVKHNGRWYPKKGFWTFVSPHSKDKRLRNG